MIWQILFAGFELAVPIAAIMGGVALAMKGNKRAGWWWTMGLVAAWAGSLIWLVTDALEGEDPVGRFVWVGALAIPGVGVGLLIWRVRKTYMTELTEDL